MRVLLFAYEFPPILAAQSLRWYYLANELARLGVEIDVLTPSFRNLWGYDPTFEKHVCIHRCFPGPFIGFSGWLAARLRAGAAVDENRQVEPAPMLPLSERLYRTARRLLDQILIPDVRTEWLPFAWRAARRLHAERHYDLVISSHEPGVDLLLGLRAQRHWGIPWIADLADPLVAPYTPRWRVALDRALERRVCKRADALLVTNEPIAWRLTERHGVPPEKLLLIRQGFDHRDRLTETEPAPAWPADRFVLLYTGTFYQGFREPGPLIEALARLENVQTIFVGDMGPFVAALSQLGERVTLLGKRPHAVCLALQRRANLLLNVGNRQDDQVPGKVYEYLGAGRPILHIAGSPTDPVPGFLESTRHGRGVAADPSAIAASIRELQMRWRNGTLDPSFDLSPLSVQEYSWAAGAARLHELMTGVSH
ncbi:hypothetical protein CCR95_19005 [Thiocystis minor]|uniref:glycosyltransferase n=1 Tax=Thiocystis minor TaxID=61597 RepID=UPI001914CB1F|nr:glycosyltransferase [Thiocystis minor]MBK5966111.1 hypothetical protein [Thiocystis minor]